MKITKVEPILCDGGWRVWSFIKIQTDEGITGYAEIFGGGAHPRAVAGCIQDLEHFLVGRDPCPVDKLCWEMSWPRVTFRGTTQYVVAAIENALWDIKAKALGVPLYELFGGPHRDKLRVYWSHCGRYQAVYSDLMGCPPVKTMKDISNLGREVVRRGFTALKTNEVLEGDLAHSRAQPTDGTQRNIDTGVVRGLVKLISTFREAVGDEVDIALDLNWHFRPEGYTRVARALEPYNLMWLEIDIHSPEALLQIKQSTRTPIGSAEGLSGLKRNKPFLDLHSMDVMLIDVPCNGFTESRRIAALADACEVMITPHNACSHLATFMSAHLGASVPNFKIMEVDIAGVPWRDDIVTELPSIQNGYLSIPTKPGIGAELNEKEIAKHPWPK